MSKIMLTNSLTDLADRVRAANEAVIVSARTTIEKAFEAGRLLTAAKAECKHGEWLPFLNRAGVNERTAQRYMALAGSGLNTTLVSDLGGVRAALEFLSRWHLPAPGEAICISDATIDAGDEGAIGRALGYVWEDDRHRGFYNIGIIISGGSDEADDECISTKRPMLPRIEADENGGPIDAIVYCLTEWMGEVLPIADWRVDYVDARLPVAMLLWEGGTIRETSGAPDKSPMGRQHS